MRPPFASDDRGATAVLDFLMGFMVFTPSFFFVLQAAPSLYSSFQQEEVALHPVAYRTSVVLVEDPGLAVNGSLNTSDWENYASNTTAVARVGLAKSRDNPNLLTLAKIGALRNLSANLSANALRIELGINASRNNPQHNVSLQRFASNSTRPSYTSDMSGNRLLSVGHEMAGAENRERVERVVVIEDPTGNLTRSGILDTGDVATDHDTNLWAVPPVGKFTITLTGKWADPPPAARLTVNFNGGPPEYSVNIPPDADSALLRTHDLTTLLNGYPAGTNVSILVTVKNVRGSYLLTGADRTWTGQPAGKLVVEVW